MILLLPLSAPRIDGVRLLGGPKVARYATAEYAVALKADYRNAFDPADVALDLRVVAPSGRESSVPGFLYRPYRRTVGRATLPIPVASTAAQKAGRAAPTRTSGDAEIMVPAGKSEWRVRFAPTEVGRYRLEFTLRTRAGVARRATSLVATAGKGGFVRVSPRDGRYFALSDGSPYWPLGANVAWAGPRGTRDYDDWLPKYGAQGANWGRVWLSPPWATFALEPRRLGEIDLGNAWRLDYVLDLARRQGVRLALCIDSYNVLRDRVSWPEWERSPQRLLLKRPADFWTDPETARRYRNKLRYLVARYGASTATMAWEFWNEADGTADYAAAPVRDWHARMAGYLHGIDPYRHPVTTSFGGDGEGAEDRATFALKGIDYSQSHRYDDPDLALGVFRAQRRLGALGKPHFVGEVGADASGDRSDDDPEGKQIHDPLWASLAAGAAGAAMPWWWDSYVGPKGLYGIFGAAARFTEGIAFDREAFRVETPTIESASPGTPMRRDAVPTTDGVGWEAAPFNAPQTVRIDARGMVAPRLARVQQGVGNHPELHNPVTFETDLAFPTRLLVEVGDVSGYGGAALRVVQDGGTVAERRFPDPDGDRDPRDPEGLRRDDRGGDSGGAAPDDGGESRTGLVRGGVPGGRRPGERDPADPRAGGGGTAHGDRVGAERGRDLAQRRRETLRPRGSPRFSNRFRPRPGSVARRTVGHLGGPGLGDLDDGGRRERNGPLELARARARRGVQARPASSITSGSARRHERIRRLRGPTSDRFESELFKVDDRAVAEQAEADDAGGDLLGLVVQHAHRAGEGDGRESAGEADMGRPGAIVARLAARRANRADAGAPQVEEVGAGDDGKVEGRAVAGEEGEAAQGQIEGGPAGDEGERGPGGVLVQRGGGSEGEVGRRVVAQVAVGDSALLEDVPEATDGGVGFGVEISFDEVRHGRRLLAHGVYSCACGRSRRRSRWGRRRSTRWATRTTWRPCAGWRRWGGRTWRRWASRWIGFSRRAARSWRVGTRSSTCVRRTSGIGSRCGRGIAAMGGARSVREVAIFRGAEEVARARTEWAFVDVASGRPRRVPAEILAAFFP